jgi:FMN reductase
MEDKNYHPGFQGKKEKSSMSNIIVISGSPSHPSRSSAISSFIEKSLIKQGHHVSTITVRDIPPEDLVYANFNSPVIKEALAQIEQAQAVIVVSPVYKATYTGVLKAFLDLIPEKGLADKVVLPVASGGSYAHLISIEYAFKPLFSILGSEEIKNGVYVVDSQITYQDKQLTFVDPDIEQRLNTELYELVNLLSKKESYVTPIK